MFNMIMCSDHRDRLYGLVGIVAEFDAYAGEFLPVDYREDIDEVYMGVTRFSTNKAQSLRLLNPGSPTRDQ